MREYTWSKWFFYKLLTVFLICVFLGLIYFVINFGELYQVLSLLRHRDIIIFNRGSLAAVGGIPILVYILFFSLRTLFSKGLLAPKKPTALGKVWMYLSVAVFAFSYIAMWIIPFVLMASPYTRCHEEKLSAYYVIDPQLCKTITPKYWQSYDDK
jgi:fatty acid desaturase